MAAGRRLGAGAVLLVLVALGVLLIGGSLAFVLTSVVDDTPAADEEAAEAADVEVVRCGQNLDTMTVRLRVTNHSAEPSDYYIDVDLVQRAPGTVLETVPAVVEDLDPGASVPVALVSTARAPAHFDCRLGDVDRLSA